MKIAIILLISAFTISGFTPSDNNLSIVVKGPNDHYIPVDNDKKPRGEKDVKWLSFEEAQKLAAKTPKKIFVDVYTDWCGWCKKMDKNTLSDPSIKEYLNKKYYAVKLNAESNRKVTYKGKEMTERELASNIFQAKGYPTTVYLDENSNVLQPISSYLEVEMLDKILHFYGEDFYKKTSWEAFESVYSSKESK